MYSKIHDDIWQTLKRKKVSRAGKLLFIYLFSCPHRSIVGLYHLPFPYIAADLGMSIREIEQTVSELFQKGLIEYERQSEFMFVKNFLAYNPLPNGNVEKAAIKFVAGLPETALLRSVETVLKPFAKQYRNLFDTVCRTVSHTEAETEATAKAETEADGCRASTPPPSGAPAPQSVVTLALNDRTEFPIGEEQVREWAALYPAVDVEQQLRAMRGWLQANPGKRKTRGGILRFVNAWLAKEQNRGGARAAGSGTGGGGGAGAGNPFLAMLREERGGQG